MANSFTLAKGEILNMTYTPTTDGVAVTVEPEWGVSSFMKREGTNTTIDLSPTIADGVIVVSYDTVDLCIGRYLIDFRMTQTGNNDIFSGQFFMYLSKTITTPSTR